MSRGRGGAQRKEGHSLNLYISMDAYRLLESHCDRMGQTKTAAIERAIRSYCYPEKSLSEEMAGECLEDSE